MRVSIIKKEQLMQGMIVAEDVYTNENQMILAHGMVLTPNIIYRLQDNSVDNVKICSDSVAVWENYQNQTSYSKRITESDEFRHFIKAYCDFAEYFEEYLYSIIRDEGFDDTGPLVDGIRKICSYTSDRIHVLDLLIHYDREEHLLIAHSINVAIISFAAARELEMTKEELDVIILAALFHDIGRIIVPDIRVRKPDRETFGEILKMSEVHHIMCDHITYGYELLKTHGFDERICNAARYHHERMDGRGYLDQDVSNEMDIYAKLIAIVDMADLTILANFKEARRNVFKTMQMFEEFGMNKFDRKLLKFCIRKVAELYLHHIAILSNGIQGEIIAINKNDLIRPIVKTHYGYIDLGKTRQLEIVQLY